MRKVLIVDDDALTTKLYCSFLERAQFQVQLATDGVTALNWLERNDVDALVVDMLMPNMYGDEFMRRVRAMDRYKNVPILAYTAAFIPEVVQQAIDSGATEVFDKSKVSGPFLKVALQKYIR
jgi:CheY-like chemotaxis protein